jgi:RND family efflux transporter MFP subunit
MRSRLVAFSLVIVLAAGLGYRVWSRTNTPVDVAVAEVRRDSITSSFSADGIVKGKSVEIAPRAAGRVAAILVAEGESVRRGQALIRLDADDLRAALREAEAAERGARAVLSQAQTALTLTRQQVTARVAQARAQLAAAEAQLQQVVAGARPEQIAQAEQQARSARAVLVAAEHAVRRARALYANGAVPRADLDEAEARYAVAAAQHRAAEEALGQVRAGARPEEVTAARAQVDSARAALDAAAGGYTEVRLRQADVETARARVDQSRAVVERTSALLAGAEVVAPFGAIVSRVDVEVGQIVSPALPVLTLVDPRELWVSADIADEDAAKARPGLRVEVTVPAYPGRRFQGWILEVAAAAETKIDAALRTRIVRAKIRLDEGAELLRPGLEVDVEGDARVVESALVIPSDALVFGETGNIVFVIDKGVARVRDVRVGYTTYAMTEILRGLTEGELVVVTGKDALADGRRVRIVRTVGPARGD